MSLIETFVCTSSKSGTYAKKAQSLLHEAAGLLLARTPGLDCLVAVESTIVGVIVFEPCDYRSFGVIRTVGVVKHRQNHGIAFDMKQRALDVCTKAGATRTFSEVHRNNLKMQRVNEKLGIQRTLDPENGKYYFYASPLVPAPVDVDI